MKDKPLLMYNTWQPFQAAMDEQLIKDCADKLALAGADLLPLMRAGINIWVIMIPTRLNSPTG